MNRHEFVAHHRMVLNVKAKAAHDWAYGVDHSEAYVSNAVVYAVYRDQWSQLERAHQRMAGWNFQHDYAEAA